LTGDRCRSKAGERKMAVYANDIYIPIFKLDRDLCGLGIRFVAMR